MGCYLESTLNKDNGVMQTEIVLLVRVSRDLESPPSSWYIKGDTHKNGDFPYKCKCLLQKDNFYSVFRVSILFAVLS